MNATEVTAPAPEAPGVAGGIPGMVRRLVRGGNVRVLLRLLGPALRGQVLGNGREAPHAEVPSRNRARLAVGYQRDRPEVARLHRASVKGQWDGDADLDWTRVVDPEDPGVTLIPEELLPLPDIPAYRKLPPARKRHHCAQLLAWMLSQFLHGEQGALLAACQVTEAVGWLDGKLFGSAQVVDEGRHVEVFHRYLVEKLEKLYVIDDNLYTVVDALVSDSRWDMKFLGMQIMIEGLALGAFCTLRNATGEPLLRELLGRVITDEARHVHFGVVALEEHLRGLPEPERREREDWAFEVAVMLRDRFLAREFYEEYYGHLMTRREWDRRVLASPYMARFRKMMFRRLVPNLKRIGLLSDRVRPHYGALGLLEFEGERAAPDLTAADLLGEAA